LVDSGRYYLPKNGKKVGKSWFFGVIARENWGCFEGVLS